MHSEVVQISVLETSVSLDFAFLQSTNKSERPACPSREPAQVDDGSNESLHNAHVSTDVHDEYVSSVFDIL